MKTENEKKKNKKSFLIYIIIIILVILLLLFIKSCSKNENNTEENKQQYIVYFNTNGGSTIEKQVILEGNYATEPSIPHKDGYTFVGWELNGKPYNFGDNITSNIELVAVWKKKDEEKKEEVNYYRIIFDSDGGSFIDEQHIMKGDYVIKPTNPTKKGYTFIGWFNEDAIFDFNSLIETDITLIAHWKKNNVVTSSKVNSNKNNNNTNNIIKNYSNTLITDESIIKYEINGNNNVRFDNFSKQNTIEKTLTIKNTGNNETYYAIVLNDLINTYDEKQIIIIAECISYKSGKVNGSCDGFNKYVGTYNSTSMEMLLDGNTIEPGFVHEYKIKISVLNNLQSNKNVFKGNIEVVKNSLPNILEVIKRDNEIFADNVNSTYVNNDIPGIDFNNPSSDTNGKGVYYTASTELNEDFDGDGKGEVVYYYRGDVKNNNLSFAGYCWKIIRTNEDGSIKLRYSGIYDDEKKCTEMTNIGSSYFNHTYGDNAYVGYMMGIENQCTNTTCSGTIRSTSYQQAHSNIYDSSIKKVIDGWYENNIVPQGEKVTSKIANTIYCNDRSFLTKENGYTGSYSQLGYGNKSTTYFGLTRVEEENLPQFKCTNKNDMFTLKVDAGGIGGYGNNALKYPIALLTADEFMYAGNKNAVENANNYLYYPTYYWAMTPGSSSTTRAGSITLERGAIYNDRVVYEEGVFPALSLRGDILVFEGTGTDTNPYIIK